MAVNKKVKPSILRKILFLDIVVFILFTLWYMHRLSSVDIIFANQALNESIDNIADQLNADFGELHDLLDNVAANIKKDPYSVAKEIERIRKSKTRIKIKEISWVASYDKYMILSNIDHYLNRNVDSEMIKKSVENANHMIVGSSLPGMEGIRSVFSIKGYDKKYIGTLLLLLDNSTLKNQLNEALYTNIHPEVSYAIISENNDIIISPLNQNATACIMQEINQGAVSYTDLLLSNFPMFGLGHSCKRRDIRILGDKYSVISIVNHKIAFEHSMDRLKFVKFDLLMLFAICFCIFIFIKYKVVMPVTKLAQLANMKDTTSTTTNHYVTKEFSDLSKGIHSLIAKQHYVMDYTNKLSFALKQIEVLRKERAEFFRNIQHVLRTPIGHIIGASDIISQYKESIPKVAQDYLHMINEASKELLSSVNTMIASFDIDAGNIELNQMYCNVKKIIEGVLQDVLPRIRQSQISLDVNIKLTPKVYIDPIWFSTAVFNIIDNAIKFSNPGGYIKVFVKRIPIGIRISIEDNGVGMSEDQIFSIEELFDNPASRNNIADTTKGVGLGLTIAHHILELHNATLSIKSSEDVGTKVTILIPNIKIKKVIKNV